MKIGVIADTHDNVPMVVKAVGLFNSEGCDLVFHAGDYCSTFALNPFSNLKCKWIGIFGNNDGDKKALSMKSDGLIVEGPYRMDLSNTRVIITHELERIEDLQGKIDRQEVHLLIYGHTHKVDIRKMGDMLVVNPGECCGWLFGKSTVAVVDLAKMEAKEIAL